MARFPGLRWLGRTRLTRLHLPDALVLLDLPAGQALERIAARGGDRQVHGTVEKPGRLGEAYRVVCGATAEGLGVAVLRLEGAAGPEQGCSRAGAFVRDAREAAGAR